jgi:hypothetical protein
MPVRRSWSGSALTITLSTTTLVRAARLDQSDADPGQQPGAWVVGPWAATGAAFSPAVTVGAGGPTPDGSLVSFPCLRFQSRARPVGLEPPIIDCVSTRSRLSQSWCISTLTGR